MTWECQPVVQSKETVVSFPKGTSCTYRWHVVEADVVVASLANLNSHFPQLRLASLLGCRRQGVFILAAPLL